MKKIMSCFLVVIFMFSFVYSVFAKDTSSTFLDEPYCYTDSEGFHDFFSSYSPDFEGCFFYEFVYDPAYFSLDVNFENNIITFYVNNLGFDLSSDVPFIMHISAFISGEFFYQGSLTCDDLDFVDSDSSFSDFYFYTAVVFVHYQTFPYSKLNLVFDSLSDCSYYPFFIIPDDIPTTSSGLPVAPTDPIEDVGGTLPVEDPSFVVGDDGASSDVIDGSNAVYSILQWLVSVFRKIVFFWIRL